MMEAWVSVARGWKLRQCAGEFMDRSLSCCEANVYYQQSFVRVRGGCRAVAASLPWWLGAPMRHDGVMAVSEMGDQSKCHLDWSDVGRWRQSKTAKFPAGTLLEKRQSPLPSSGKGGMATGIGDGRPGGLQGDQENPKQVYESARASVRRRAVPSRARSAGAGDPGI